MTEEDRIEVAVVERTVYLKPFGYATQQNSLGIPDFLTAMYRAGCASVAVDLADCKGMDSTFLGVIAVAATAGPRRRGKCVVVLNAAEKMVRQLRRIGLLPLVSLHEGEAVPPADLRLRQVDFVHFPKTEYQKLQKVRFLHEQLTQLNEKNRQIFGPFIRMLEDELRPYAEGKGDTQT